MHPISTGLRIQIFTNAFRMQVSICIQLEKKRKQEAPYKFSPIEVLMNEQHKHTVHKKS